MWRSRSHRTGCGSSCWKRRPECFSNREGAVPTDSGAELLTRLASELGKMPNHILIEGHTDAKPFASDSGYSNWELSADRANSARKLMQAHGIRHGAGRPGSRLCRPAVAPPRRSHQCVQPPDLRDRSVSGRPGTEAEEPARGRNRPNTERSWPKTAAFLRDINGYKEGS